MSELPAKIAHLVSLSLAVGKARAKDRELGQAFNEALAVFEPDDDRAMKLAIAHLDAGLAKAKDDRAEEVLRLAVGVLVEGGASPEIAWPTAERGLMDAIKLAKKYAQAALDQEDTPSIRDAIQWAGTPLQEKMPREYQAWRSLKSRALVAIACLSHSAKLRVAMQKTRTDLIGAIERLEDDVEQLLFLRQLMRVIPDQTMLVIHPEQRRGLRVVVKEITTNIELMVLLHAAVLGDPKKGFIAGPRPNPKAVEVLLDPEHGSDKPVEVTLPFFWSSWRALRPDGTLPDASDQRKTNWVWFEDVPLQILPFRGERVILLCEPIMPREMSVEGSFEALEPSVTVKEKLSRAEVDRLLLAMGKAAVKADAIAIAEEAQEHERIRLYWEAEAKKAKRAVAKRAVAKRAAAKR